MLYSVLLAATTAVLASASPIKRDEPTYAYSVTNWSYGCSPGGCAWQFNLTGPANGDDAPAFSTYCTGTGYATDYVPCEEIPGGIQNAGAIVNANSSSITLNINYEVLIEHNTGRFDYHAESKVEPTGHCPTCPTEYTVPVTYATGVL